MPTSLFSSASPQQRQRLEADITLKLLNEHDWSSTPLGPITSWPESLKGAVRLMMTASTPMTMMVGEQGILLYNHPYAEFAGGRHPEIFGKPYAEAWPEVAEFNRHKLELGLAGDALTLRRQELLLNRHGQPEPVWLDIHYSPVLDETGTSLGTLCIVHEITDRILAEQALIRSEERLSLALSGSDLVGTWDWNVTENLIAADDRTARLYNIDPLHAGLGVPVERFLDAIHPDDVARVRADIEHVLNHGGDYRSEYRVTGADGVMRWVVASGRPRLGPSGRAERFPGLLVDVSEQRRAAEALAQSELRFRTLTEAMPQMVWSTRADGYHDYYNARWYEFTGAPVGSTEGEGWNNMFHPEDQERAWATWRHSLETGEPYQIEYRLRHHTGVYRWTLGLAMPIRDPDGSIVRWFGTCTDIHDSRLIAEERELVAQELSHRIKNIFAVLIGIVSLSARGRSDVKPFADELRERIFALGEAHDFIRPRPVSDGPVPEATVRGLIERLLRPYRRGDSLPLEFLGDDMPIDDGVATPLALLFHELGTNAAKYGALGTSGEGRVVVSGHVDSDRYHLSWKEICDAAVEEPPRQQGFGTRLVTLSVEGQLRGNIERIWEADGLRVEIGLPLDMLRRSARLRGELAEEPAQ
jgi:PAS domain S-box-containing protein